MLISVFNIRLRLAANIWRSEVVEHKGTSGNRWLIQSNRPKSIHFLLHYFRVHKQKLLASQFITSVWIILKSKSEVT